MSNGEQETSTCELKLPRGSMRIRAIVERLEPLTIYLTANTYVERICMDAADYEFIRRWPRAAEAQEFVITDCIHWRRFLIYPKAITEMHAEQTDLANG